MAAFNLKEAITEALSSLGGSGSAAEVREYIKSKFGRDWKTIEKVMDDMSVESESSFFLPEERVLKRMGQGKYALKEAAIQEPGEEIATEEPKTAPTGAIKSTLEETIASYSDKLTQVLKKPTYNFVQATPEQIPAEPGVYLIHDDTSNQLLYAGRTGNLRTSLLQQDKRGNIEGSQFRKALGQNLNLNDEAKISDFIVNNCSFQFLPVENFEERVRLEHFLTAILAPPLNTKLQQ